MEAEIGLGLITFLVAIVSYFLRQKDEQQAAQIKLLFEKHDADAAALQELRVQIASRHYERPELDAKFDKLEATFKEGFHNLGNKFDKLSDALIAHIQREDAGK